MSTLQFDPISATKLSPVLCNVCLEKSDIPCPGCGNALYCSEKCLQDDQEQHRTVCNQFTDDEVLTRPSPYRYRAIHFPVDADTPQFIWLLMNGPRGGHSVSDNDLDKYISRSKPGREIIDRTKGLDAQKYRNMLIVDFDSDAQEGGGPVNQCLAHMVGPQAANRRGGYVVHAYKYQFSDHLSQIQAGDRIDGARPRIALNLDTTSLRPVIEYFSKY
jgi:hypothetical protein